MPIFGEQLFQGSFRDVSFRGFNPYYQVSIGDQIQVMIWGAFDELLEREVDAQGNIFLPRVGPVKVQGIRNKDLNELIASRVGEVYTDNVEVYANLLSAQSVKVFVSGFVAKPGLYEGFASDSILYFLDLAGGVDPLRGSYISISLIRGNESIKTLNLYDFLQNGRLPLTQFRDGDVILVGSQGNTVRVSGAVNNPALFEYKGDRISLDTILEYAAPRSGATSVMVRRAREGDSTSIVRPMDDLSGLYLYAGDHVNVTARHIARNLLIYFEGEHEGPSHKVLPQGSKFQDALELINPSPRSSLDAVHLYRRSVAQRQKELLHQSLDNLERSIVGANSSFLEEAQLRQMEAEIVRGFIERARDIEPRGQIIIEDLGSAKDLPLEDGDTLFIPAKSQLVNVHGEVKYPNTQTHRPGDRLPSYLERAGGFSENADTGDIIVVRPNGMIDSVGRGRRTPINPGDEIIVLPKPDEKRFLFAREISTIIYQVALSARVVIGL